jgi:hypothetical protein
MKKMGMACLVLLTALPAMAQSTDELKREIAQKQAEISRLRERIAALEKNLSTSPAQPASAAPAADPADAHADTGGERALERALVRESGLLLPPGRWEAEPDFVYSHSEDNAGTYRRNAYGPALTLRAGLPWRSQVAVSVPYVFERNRIGTTENRNDGIGDVSLTLSHQLLTEQGARPGVIGSLSYQAATGKNTVFDSVMPTALGSGFDTLQASVTAVKRVDPLVFFGSYSYTHTYSERKNGLNVSPGNNHGLRFGTLLAASPDTSLRAALNLNFYDETRFDGVTVPNSDDHSALLEIGSSIVLNKSTALDISVGAGLTRDMPKYRVGVALPVRF